MLHLGLPQMDVESGMDTTLMKWCVGGFLMIMNPTSLSWSIHKHYTNHGDTLGNLLMATKLWMISGYSTPVENDSFGCLPIGGDMGLNGGP